MKILLTLPFDLSCSQESQDLGLGYLASALREAGHEVELCLRFDRLSTPSQYAQFVKAGKFDLYGLKVFSSQVKSVNLTIDLIRRVDPGATIVLGGGHVSGDPDNIFTFFPGADFGIKGEAEISFPRLVSALSASPRRDTDFENIPGLVFRQNGATVVNEHTFCEDLDALQFPAWDLMRPDSFPGVPFNGYSRRYPIAPMILTRGCPFKCTFCGAYKVNGHHIRSRSVDNIIEELRLLTGKYGVREIHFYDSNCAYPKGPLKEVLRRIISEKIDISWSAPVGMRLDSIDPELVDLMKTSGCFQVDVGIESGSPRILKQIRKSLSLETARKSIALLRGAGIEVVGLFMIGLPTETRREIRQTTSLAMSLPLTGASFSIYCPLPGTDDYDRLLSSNQLDEEVLSSFDFRKYKNNLSEVPEGRLKQIQRTAYLRFHLRPRILYYFAKNLNSVSKVRFIAKRILELIR